MSFLEPTVVCGLVTRGYDFTRVLLSNSENYWVLPGGIRHETLDDSSDIDFLRKSILSVFPDSASEKIKLGLGSIDDGIEDVSFIQGLPVYSSGVRCNGRIYLFSLDGYFVDERGRGRRIDNPIAENGRWLDISDNFHEDSSIGLMTKQTLLYFRELWPSSSDELSALSKDNCFTHLIRKPERNLLPSKTPQQQTDEYKISVIRMKFNNGSNKL